MNSIGYYPGCSLSGTAAEYDRSLKAVAGRLGVELKEIPDWVCCGASSAHAIDHEASLCLAADTLAKARRAGLNQILAPCAMCYSRLASAVHTMAEKPALARQVTAALGESEELAIHQMQPLNLLHWLENLPSQAIQQQVSKPLTGLKVACYYGCLLVRPGKVTGAAEVEAPRNMENLVQMLGAQPVRWTMATECCGGSFAVSRKQVVLRQSRRIYESARKAGADVICLACPMCHSNLDVRQAEMGIAPSDRLPVVYLTQLAGLAFGLSGQALGFGGHFVPVEPAVQSALEPKPVAAK